MITSAIALRRALCVSLLMIPCALLAPAPVQASGPPILVSSFGCNCSGNFTSMRGVAAGSDGNVYQVDGLKLHKHDANGTRLSTDILEWCTPPGAAPGPAADNSSRPTAWRAMPPATSMWWTA